MLRGDQVEDILGPETSRWYIGGYREIQQEIFEKKTTKPFATMYPPVRLEQMKKQAEQKATNVKAATGCQIPSMGFLL